MISPNKLAFNTAQDSQKNDKNKLDQLDISNINLNANRIQNFDNPFIQRAPKQS